MLTKAELRKRWSELRALVNQWDAVGLIEAGAPQDEYECLVGPILRMLEERVSGEQIRRFPAKEFAEHFGVPIGDPSEFVETLIEWYSRPQG